MKNIGIKINTQRAQKHEIKQIMKNVIFERIRFSTTYLKRNKYSMK